MKKFFVIVFFILGLFLTSGQVSAELAGMSSNELVELCTKDSSNYDKNECARYIQGSFDMLRFLYTTFVTDDGQCYNAALKNVTPSQISKLFVKYLDENPKYLHYSASMIIHRIVITTFSTSHCKK